MKNKVDFTGQYRLLRAINKKTNKEQTNTPQMTYDEKVGCVLSIYIDHDSSAAYLELRSNTSGIIAYGISRTSPLLNCELSSGGLVRLETLNTIYEFEKISDSDT